MFKKVCFLVFTCAAVVLTGCVSTQKKSAYSVLQVPSTTRIYLSSNLWFQPDGQMESSNYQMGDILSYGTEVTGIDYDDQYITFTAKLQDQRFRIEFMKEYAMMSIEEYIKQIFQVKNPVEVELSIEPLLFERISRGVVEKGMTKQHVLMAYGYPSAHRTSSLDDDTWIYMITRGKSKRVVFRNGKVLSVLNN